jgi:hypothetical protein
VGGLPRLLLLLLLLLLPDCDVITICQWQHPLSSSFPWLLLLPLLLLPDLRRPIAASTIIKLAQAAAAAAARTHPPVATPTVINLISGLPRLLMLLLLLSLMLTVALSSGLPRLLLLLRHASIHILPHNAWQWPQLETHCPQNHMVNDMLQEDVTQAVDQQQCKDHAADGEGGSAA